MRIAENSPLVSPFHDFEEPNSLTVCQTKGIVLINDMCRLCNQTHFLYSELKLKGNAMPDQTIYTYSMPSGAEIEIQGLPDDKAGASDVGLLDDAKKKVKQKAFSLLGEFANEAFESIIAPISKPVSVTLEFGAAVKGENKFLVTSFGGNASIKVSLTWENKPQQSG